MNHQTLVHGLHLDPAPRTEVIEPTLLRYDVAPDIIERFYDDLRQPDWLDRLKYRADLPVRFGLPLVPQGRHRKAVIVVVDAACLIPGFPRVDPGKVVQSALVIRREKDGATEAWLNDANDRPIGWRPVPGSALLANSSYDPDAAFRRERLTHANPVLKRKATITGDEAGVSEAVAALHPIPADIAEQIGRTLYFGVLKTTSQAVEPGNAPPPPFNADDVAERVPNILRHDRDGSPLPATSDSITRAELRDAPSTIIGGIETNALAGLRAALTWMAQETGLFTAEDYAAELKAELQSIALSGGSKSNLFAWMEAAQSRLIEGKGTSINTPDDWPAISLARFTRIRDAAFAAMAARWGRLSPSITRFGPIGERYHVRCMLRIDDMPGCPPRILWSPLSTRYTIRPWYESDGGPVNQVELPDLDLDALKAIAPDVAVKVPPKIQQFMDKLNLNDLMNGEAKTGPSLNFGMICGFSIPIITICAFFILQIFLSLLNIIFFWLPFVKICIPFPKVEE